MRRRLCKQRKTFCQLSKDAETGALKVLGDQVRSNPDRIASSVPKLYSRLESGNFAFPFVSFHRINSIGICIRF